MYLLEARANDSAELLRENIRNDFKKSQDQTQAVDLSRVRLTVSDNDVADANKLCIHATNPYPIGVFSVWLNSANDNNRQAIEDFLNRHCKKIHGYLVTESEPLINQRHPAETGKRTYGMNQVVLLRRPKKLSYKEWIDIWHNSHTQIAIDTQSTFGYRQNVVVRPVTKDALAVDAIVEENFPPEAMSSAHAFYNAKNDEEMKKNQQIMIDSVSRFLEFDKLDCLPMSEYNL